MRRRAELALQPAHTTRRAAGFCCHFKQEGGNDMKDERPVRAERRGTDRSAISLVGWMGIAAIVLGLAYFVLLPEVPGSSAERRPSPPEARGEAPPARVPQQSVRVPVAAEAAHERHITLKRGDTLRTLEEVPSR